MDDLFLLGVLIACFFFGLIVMAIANNKGRRDSNFGFFLLGFCFTLIGLIIVLVMEDKSGKYKSESPNVIGESVNYLICPDCGITIKGDSRFCKNCGYSFSEKANINFCSNCGSKLKVKLNYCHECGHKINS